MARGRKKNKRKSSLKKDDLPAVAQSYLSKGKFSEAIKAFRILHKKDRDGRWGKLFAQAYLGRLKQLSAKGMVKEALVIYDNMQLVFPDPDILLYIRLLIGAGRSKQAVEVGTEVGSTLARHEQAVVDELFASLLLAGQKQLKDLLPDESPVFVHYGAAERALQAYCRMDDNGAHAALREIPFRSPYKNFSLALKGMLAFEKDRNDSLPFFEKIPADSPFLSLTVPYRQLTSANHGQMKNFTAIELKVVNTLAGMDSGTAGLLNSLNTLKMSPTILYQTFVRKGNCLGKKQLKNICYRILPHAPGIKKDFQKRFGRLSKLEDARLEALIMELAGDEYVNGFGWYNVCQVLLELKASGSDNSLEIALVYRHIVEIIEERGLASNSKMIEEILTNSLDFDPKDQETWLKLIELNRFTTAKRYKLINSMLAIFPDDREVMTLAIEAAIQRGAFKKASRLAEKLLAADPINPKVRIMLIDAHLGHALKMAKQQKYTIALRECSLAASFERQNLSKGRILIFQGLITIKSGDEAGGLKLLEEVLETASNRLLVHFAIRMEAELQNISPQLLKVFTAQLKKATKISLGKDVILQLIEEISLCNGKKHLILENFRSIVTPCLKRSAGLAFSMDELKRICQVFLFRHYHDLLLKYAKISLKKYRRNPLFQFYLIHAKIKGGEKRLSQRQFDTLDNAWQEAMDMNDVSTAALIEDLLDKQFPIVGKMDFEENQLQMIQEIFGDELVERLERGETPTEKDLDEMVEEYLIVKKIMNEKP